MFRIIDCQISEAEKEIAEYNKLGIDVQKIKYQFLRSFVLLIVSEYENLIEKIFCIRASKCNDTQVINFVKSQVEKKFRSPDLGKINDMIGFFDNDLKQKFIAFTTTGTINSAWNNIMKARHCIVHKQGSLNLTYEELLKTYPNTQAVINELVKILGLKSDEIK